MSLKENDIWNEQQQELKQEYFHSQVVGCKMDMVRLWKKPWNKELHKPDYYAIYGYFCSTHQVYCYRDGWEIGHYLGNTNSPFNIKDYKVSKLSRIRCKYCGKTPDNYSQKLCCGSTLEDSKNLSKRNEFTQRDYVSKILDIKID